MGFRQSSSYFKRDFQNSNLGTVASFKPFLYSAGKEVISLTKYQAMEPSWDLSIPSPSPSPLRGYEGVSSKSGNNHHGNQPQTPGRLMISTSENSFSIIDPVTPSCVRMGSAQSDQSPQSSNMAQKRGVSSTDHAAIMLSSEELAGLTGYTPPDARLNKLSEFPRVFVATKNCSSADLLLLERSIIAAIEKNNESYICLHDVADYVSKQTGISISQITWKNFDERTFLISLPDKLIRDKFLQASSLVRIADGLVTFKPWKPAVGVVKKPCRAKVWLRLTGLPVEHFCPNTVERVVCTFGRLARCNMEKKLTYLGCFYVMIDCPDVDEIKSRVYVQTDNDSEIPVFVDKLYACPLDIYNSQNFREGTPYDDILSTLLDRSKLIHLYERYVVVHPCRIYPLLCVIAPCALQLNLVELICSTMGL